MNLIPSNMSSHAAIDTYEGINFLTDSAGNRKAVLIDLGLHGELLEEFFDVIISQKRLATNDRVSFEEIKQELMAEGRLPSNV